MAKQEELSFFEFEKRFNSEEECRDHLFRIRRQEGLEYPKCSNRSYYQIQKRNRHQCTSCRHQTSVRTGTAMDKRHICLEKWF